MNGIDENKFSLLFFFLIFSIKDGYYRVCSDLREKEVLPKTKAAE
jgi:hypothetical protein